MGFRLFGVNVEVQIGFWIMSFLLGWQGNGAPGPDVVIWVAVVFLSVLAHEFGHAFAIKRHGIEPEISLHWMGGTTRWRQLLPLRRRDHIVISLAGPFAGFALGGLVLLFDRYAPVHLTSPYVALALSNLLWVNFGWGIVNLAPVLPFDGGHVLEQALGPTRARATAIISLIAGFAIALLFWRLKMTWGAVLFAMSAVQSYQRFRAAAAPVRVLRPTQTVRREEPLPSELGVLLRRAREALADEDLPGAISLAEQVLNAPVDPDDPSKPKPPRAIHGALQVIAWAHLMAGRLDEAAEFLARASKIEPADPSLAGSVMLARGNRKEARRIFEAARAAGDDRKELVGPLIQVLLEDGEVGRAAAVAYDIVDALSEEDARRMGKLAFEGRAYDWSARLFEAVFRRDGHADDAYEAARALSLDGETEKALDLLRKAVAAGFSDRTRAWSDAALEALRGDHLEAVLPRP